MDAHAHGQLDPFGLLKFVIEGLHRGNVGIGDHLVVQGAGGLGLYAVAVARELGVRRQALHAAVLGFVHPDSGAHLRFVSPLPPDLALLV